MINVYVEMEFILILIQYQRYFVQEDKNEI